MYVTNDNNNVNFERVRIRVKGAEFKNHPEDKERIIEALRNNAKIQEFFKNRNGKITVTSGVMPFIEDFEYPACIKRVPSRSLPFDKFPVKRPNYYTNIMCLYSRAFALRNLLKKRVYVDSGIKAPEGERLSWEECVEYTIRLINEKLPDSIWGCEERRLKVEKP